MFAPEKRRWSLKLVKWWAGWAPSEKAETVTRYLLDDVLDQEENVLGDSLAPDSVSCSDAAPESIRRLDYGDAQMNSDGTEELQATMSPRIRIWYWRAEVAAGRSPADGEEYRRNTRFDAGNGTGRSCYGD
ncbi:hypothetical protein ON010_g8208 [Phytophthora cinnamomi]|nr:hypothetical protein ON010_g8208 [Phytophthora cinnamomi]